MRNMKAFDFKCALAVALVLAALSIGVSSQQPSGAAPQHSAVSLQAPSGMVLEVMYVKGRILAYQRIGEWTWYGFFERVTAGKSRPGELHVDAVKIATRLENGVIKARVTVLRGTNHEAEDFVADYAVTPEKKITIRELSDVGVEPFEMQLVRAPSVVAEPPAVVNKTKSLEVSVEPAQSTIPTFSARFLNNSPKPVASFSYYTSVDGSRHMSGSPRNETGEALIKPGDTLERKFRYAMKVSAVSTGEVPPALPNLILNVTSVVFTDGTYEGDPLPVANFLTIKLGEKAQLRSFLDLVRSKGFTNSPGEIEAAIASVNADSVVAELTPKFPTLTAQDKAQLLGLVDLGKSLAAKFFKSISGEPVAAVAERLQKRIDSMP